MMLWRRISLLLVAIWSGFIFGIPSIAQSPSPPKNLFSQDEILELEISAPFSDLTRKMARSTDPFPAKIHNLTDGETLGLELSARGNSRRTRGICQFPPLRVRFDARPEAGVFEGQKSLKLVTHCKDKDKYEQNLLLEYQAYRLFSRLTDKSLKVRLAQINYLDDVTGKPIATRFGFFIEDMDDLAERHGLKEFDLPATRHVDLEAKAAANIEMFQFMIGNLDFSMTRGPKGADCCHNVKLMGADTTGAPPHIPVPYDFDNTGWVDPDYALLPGGVDVRNIRERRFRGNCSRISDFRRLQSEFYANKSDWMSLSDIAPHLTEKRAEKVRKYLQEFFDILNNPKKFESQIIKACR